MSDKLTFTSHPFEHAEPVPTEYTCEGADVSPPLAWDNVPDTAESLALIVDDPDTPGRTFTHWILFNLSPDQMQLPRDFDVHPAETEPPPVEGTNDFGDTGYGGPCPPPGDDSHRYFFRLYALDTTLGLGPVPRKHR